jgi:hypothetical protein
MLEFLFVVMAQAAAGAPAEAAPAPSAAVEGTVAAEPAGAAVAPAETDIREIVRCRRIVATGSRLGARRCTTLRQDEEQRENTRQELERLQDSGRHQNPQGG